jgi:conjugative transfer pilus assembly protein TraH
MLDNRSRKFKITMAIALGSLLGAGLTETQMSYAGLNSVLSNMLIAAGSPGVYSTQNGGVVAGGYAAVTVPDQAYNIIAFAPPSISAGCGGINLFLGSFSFISGQQILNLVKQIGQGLVVYAFYSAISSMCSQCSNILSYLEKIAQTMNNAMRNTCNFNAGMTIKNFAQGISSATTQFEHSWSASSGSSTDFTKSVSNFASNPVQSISNWASNSVTSIQNDWSTGWNNGAPPTAGARSAANISGTRTPLEMAPNLGNLTWRAILKTNPQNVLSNLSANTYTTVLASSKQFTTREILMSLVGTTVVSPPRSNTATNSGNSGSGGASTMSPKFVTYSVPASLTLKEMVDGNPQTKFLQCETPSSSNGSGSLVTYYQYIAPYGASNKNSCVNVITGNTFQDIDYKGIDYAVNQALVGKTGSGGLYGAIVNQTTSNLTTAEQGIVDGSPIPILALGNDAMSGDTANNPTLVKTVLELAKPYIEASIAAKYGEAMQQAAQLIFGASNHMVQPPLGYQQSMDLLAKQIDYYNSISGGSTREGNALATLIRKAHENHTTYGVHN